MDRCDVRVISVVLVDDHPVLLHALSALINSAQDMTVLATAGDADEAISLVEATRPDVVVMDVDMPGSSCFEVSTRICAARPETKIIIFTALWEDRLIVEALRSGARSYILKRENPEIIREAIHRVMDGGFYFSDEVLSRIVVDDEGALVSKTLPSRSSTLSEREIEVLRLIAKGLARKQIALQLNRSINTIGAHTDHIMRKLGIHDRVELARYAIREGMIDP